MRPSRFISRSSQLPENSCPRCVLLRTAAARAWTLATSAKWTSSSLSQGQKSWCNKLFNGFDNQVRWSFQGGPYLDLVLDSLCFFFWLNPSMFRALLSFCLQSKYHRSTLNITSNSCVSMSSKCSDLIPPRSRVN